MENVTPRALPDANAAIRRKLARCHAVSGRRTTAAGYVGLETGDAVDVIDAAKNDVIARVLVGQAPQALVFVPDATDTAPATGAWFWPLRPSRRTRRVLIFGGFCPAVAQVACVCKQGGAAYQPAFPRSHVSSTRVMPVQITRKHEIHCGHRICDHDGKCRNLHGHAHVIHFTCEASSLDPLGRVIDFGVIKSLLCQWLEDNWDHRMLIWEHDPILDRLRVLDPSVVAVPFNPTAENIAVHLVNTVGPELLAGTSVRLVRVQVDETSKCSAIFHA